MFMIVRSQDVLGSMKKMKKKISIDKPSDTHINLFIKKNYWAVGKKFLTRSSRDARNQISFSQPST